jgi:chromosome segregation ATPase
LELTNNLNLSLKRENEESQAKFTELGKSNAKLDSDFSSKQNEIQELKQKIMDLKNQLSTFSSDKLLDSDEYENLNKKLNKRNDEINELKKKLLESNELIKSLKEENFGIKFSNDKIKDENESMISIYLLIKKDFNSFLSSLSVSEFNQEMQNSNKEIDLNEKKLETQVVCKIKILKNITENLEYKNELFSKEIDILKSELERNNNLLAIKQREIDILSKQNKDIHKNLNDSSVKANDLNKKIKKLEKEIEEKTNEIQSLIKAQTGTSTEKVEKLSKTLYESSKVSEVKINEIKKEYELKMKNLEEERTKILGEKYDEIISLKANNKNVQNEKEKLIISEFFKTNLLELINNSKSYLKKFEIEENYNFEFNNIDLKESDLDNYMVSLKRLIERYNKL